MTYQVPAGTVFRSMQHRLGYIQAWTKAIAAYERCLSAHATAPAGTIFKCPRTTRQPRGTRMTRDEVIRVIGEHRLIAILRGDFREREVELARALLEGGVRALEVSTVSPGWEQVLRRLVDAVGNETAVGVGTVLSADHVRAAADAGACFMVAPNTSPAVMAKAHHTGMAVFPGAFTPTEIVAAIDAGADAVKLFPAVTAGPEYLRALRGPLPEIRVIPTGGVSVDNLTAWFCAGAWAVAVGSERGRSNDAEAQDWARLRERARRFAERARKKAA